MEYTPQTALSSPEIRSGQGLAITRRFTTAGTHPFDEVVWEKRTASVGTFTQEDVEFPASWSQNATNIVAQKYFRGQLGNPARERSAAAIAAGRSGAYCSTSLGIWLCASRSVFSECAHGSSWASFW